MRKIILTVLFFLAAGGETRAVTYMILQGSQTVSGRPTFSGGVIFSGTAGITITSMTVTSATFNGPILLNGNAGTAGQVLQSNGANSTPSWETVATTPSISATSFTWTGQNTFNQMPTMPACQLQISSMGTVGTTNNKIVQMFAVAGTGAAPFQYLSSGTCYSFSNNAIAGASITINTTGKYFLSYQRDEAVAAQMGISINSTELTTNFPSITVGRAVCSTVAGQGAAADFEHSASCMVFLYAGDVVRLHTQGGTQSGTSAQRMNFFNLTFMP